MGGRYLLSPPLRRPHSCILLPCITTTSFPSKGSTMFLDKKTSIKILIMRNDFRGTVLECTLVRSMASSRNRTVKPWNSIQIEEEDVQFLETFSWLFWTEWRITPDNYAIKHDKPFNFICIQRTRISFMWLDQFSFRVCDWFKKKIVFLSPRGLA